MKRILFLVLVLVMVMSGLALAAPKGKKSSCVECHTKTTPGVVEQHMDGKMAKAGVDCSACHGTDHNSMNDAAKAKMPTPATCEKCHSTQVHQFKKGKHNLAWIASSAMPMWSHQPKAVAGDGYKGCSACHRVGEKPAAEQAATRYGHAQCDSCHTRHAFKKSEAQDPRACMTCHMGFDHPQWEMYSTSKHGAIWQIEGKDSKRAPRCQTCHMAGGDHNVLTSWGFLALRLPEEDKDWLNDRVVILQGLGVLDEKGAPTARLEVVKAGNVARLTKEAFDAEREKMLKVCNNCHGASYAKRQLDEADKVVKDADKLMADAIREVQALYRDGILKKPASWTMAPDLLQFYDAETGIEQELWVMFLEYRMRTFQGAFHMNPDYMHWYGWSPMKETLAKIREEAKKMRAEHAKK